MTRRGTITSRWSWGTLLREGQGHEGPRKTDMKRPYRELESSLLRSIQPKVALSRPMCQFWGDGHAF